MSEPIHNYFVNAAIIAAHLDKATKVAQQLSLTASNARAVALRAGEGAAGFRPLTDFIDKLANVTIKSSSQINIYATNLSKTAANKFRADNAVAKFNYVVNVNKDDMYISSLTPSLNKTVQNQKQLFIYYHKQLANLRLALEDLNGELRTAVILATLSRVEASQAKLEYQDSLNSVADNVESAASKIKKLIENALQLVSTLKQEE